MSDALDGQGSKEQALQNGQRLLSADPGSAERQARIIIDGDPECIDAHGLLGIALRRLGRADEARRAEQRAIDLSMLRQPLFEAVMTLAQQQPGKSQRLAMDFLKEHPDNAAAMRMVAEVAARMGRLDEAERFVAGALAVAPDFDRAIALRATIQRIRKDGPDASGSPFRSRIAWPEPAAGQRLIDEGIQLYEATVGLYPDRPEIWVGYGHVLRTVGEQDDAVAKYRQAIAARPTFGEAWYAIGDLKAGRYTPQDVEDLRRLAKAPDVDELDRAQLHFALGRALEQHQVFEASFEAFAEGNRLRSLSATYDRTATSRHVDQSIALFDRRYFESRAGGGEPAADPIFVLGLPRAGSTLIEQILASHPQIEPTGELSDILNLTSLIPDGPSGEIPDDPYLDRLAALPATELQRLGRAYLWNAGLKRRTSKPYFVDKMPNNWLHVGFILSILPNAKIIDARRHPMACCFSNFRQYFASGQEFTYDLGDIGHFYTDYIRMMAHFDAIAPGRVHRVIHEELVADPETEIRRMLDYIGVEFDEACLRFHENRREVRTASSEQVRRPINREGIDQWRSFEPWLGPLKEVLGPVLDCYPAAPAKF